MPRNSAQVFARTVMWWSPRLHVVLSLYAAICRDCLERFGQGSQRMSCDTVDSACDNELTENGFVLDEEEGHLHRGQPQVHRSQGHSLDFELHRQAGSLALQLCSGGVMQFWCGRKLDHEVLFIGCGSVVSMDCRNLFRTTSSQMYNGISSDTSRSEFFKCYVDPLLLHHRSFLPVESSRACFFGNSKFMSLNTGYKSGNVWRGWKHSGTHTYIGHFLSDLDCNHKGRGDARDEPHCPAVRVGHFLPRVLRGSWRLLTVASSEVHLSSSSGNFCRGRSCRYVSPAPVVEHFSPAPPVSASRQRLRCVPHRLQRWSTSGQRQR